MRIEVRFRAPVFRAARERKALNRDAYLPCAVHGVLVIIAFARAQTNAQNNERKNPASFFHCPSPDIICQPYYIAKNINFQGFCYVSLQKVFVSPL